MAGPTIFSDFFVSPAVCSPLTCCWLPPIPAVIGGLPVRTHPTCHFTAYRLTQMLMTCWLMPFLVRGAFAAHTAGHCSPAVLCDASSTVSLSCLISVSHLVQPGCHGNPVQAGLASCMALHN